MGYPLERYAASGTLDFKKEIYWSYSGAKE